MDKVTTQESGGDFGLSNIILYEREAVMHSCRRRVRVPCSSPASPGKRTSNCAGALFLPEQLCELKAPGIGGLVFQPFGMTSLQAFFSPLRNNGQ